MRLKDKYIDQVFSNIQLKWNLLILVKVFLISIVLVYFFFQLIKPFGNPIIYSILIFLASAGLCTYYFRLGRIGYLQVARLLDRQVASMEDSSYLLLEKDNLTTIAKLQQETIAQRVGNDMSSISYPVPFKLTLIACLGLILVSISWSFIYQPKAFEPILLNAADETVENSGDIISPVKISNYSIEVIPPSYTGISSSTLTDFHLEIPSGSQVTWKLGFNQPINSASLVWGLDEKYPVKPIEDNYEVSSRISSSGFYSFLIETSNDTLHTEFYRVDVIPDLPPKISNLSPELYTRAPYDDKIAIPVHATVSDDYGLSDVYVVATVSKGSGESVKFREEKVNFGVGVKGKRRIDLKTSLLGSGLKLEPGSELYYYIEAWDNKMPNPNRTRTETYFFVVEDIAATDYSDFGGLAVDLMPDYFRSQRQIIIETEKLIKDKPKLAVKDFKFISNELGFDQKVLRLKYSQFLGEEFESGIELENDEIPQPDEALEILEETHSHDEELDPNAEEDPLEAVSHTHDTEEETSYFSISVEAKLRAALIEMWDAELHLRLYDPKKSLPYQYRALELIKEIKNHARIYVKRIGFEPPPLTEEKRLQGKQDDINPKQTRLDSETPAVYTNITLATTILDNVILSERQLSEHEKSILKACGNEIAYLVEANPLRYLEILQELKRISDNESLTKIQLEKLRKNLYQILQNKKREPGANAIQRDALKANYFKAKSN